MAELVRNGLDEPVMLRFSFLRKGTGLLLVLFLIFIVAGCDSDSDSADGQRGNPIASDRRVVPRSWSGPQTIDVGLSPFRPGSNIRGMAGVPTGALLALGVFGDPERTSADPHRLTVLRFRDGLWSILIQLHANVPFNTAAVSVDDNERPVVFWVGDPTGESDESAQQAGLFAQPATTLYACRIEGGACERTDSLEFGRQIRARIQDQILFNGAISISMLEMPFFTHFITYRTSALRQADDIFGRFGKFVKVGMELLFTGIDPKELSSSGLRVFSSRWSGEALNAPVTVFETPSESAMDVSTPEVDFDDNVHIAFLATGEGRERVYHVQSGDGGNSWNEATLLREQSPFVMDPISVLRDEAGVIHVIMGSATGFGQFEWHQRTFFQGEWSELEPFPPTVGLSPRAVHTARMGDGRLMAVWRDDDDMYFSVYE